MKWGHYADKEGIGTNIMATNIIYYQRYYGYNGYRNIMAVKTSFALVVLSP